MGKQMEIEIRRMANNGKGVGTAPDGKTVFVSGAVPGDRLLVEITAEKSRLYEARILSILSPSPDRIASDCSELDRCGGCCFRQMTYERELAEKTGFVNDAFRRIGKFDVDPEPIISSPLTEAYRNKAEFAVGTDAEGKLFAGFYSEKTHRVIPILNCHLIPKEILKITNTFLNIININKNSNIIEREIFPSETDEFPEADGTYKDLLRMIHTAQEELDREITLKKSDDENIKRIVNNTKSEKGIIKQIILRKSGLTGEILLFIVTTGDIGEKLTDAAKRIRAEFPSIRSVCMAVSPSSGTIESVRFTRILSGSRFIRDQICGVPVDIGPLSFFQVNTPAAEALYRIAAEYADVRTDDVVLDLYCGMGTIGLSIASGCAQLIGGEIIPEAVGSAKRNAAAMGLTNVHFLCGDAAEIAQILIRDGIHPNLIILDPPRKGCSPETLQAVLALNPDSIVMVSCDPATAARDCRNLCDQGYTLTRLRPVDLFPRTKHVETVCLLYHQKTDFISVPYESKDMDCLNN